MAIFGRVVMFGLAITFATQPVIATDTGSFRPDGQWTVGSNGIRCMGFRPFKDGEKISNLIITDYLKSSAIKIGFSDAQDPHEVFQESTATIAVDGQNAIAGRAVHLPSRIFPGSEMIADVAQDAAESVRAANSITISDRGRTSKFENVTLAPAYAALDRCRSETLSRLSVDPAEMDRAVTPPRVIGPKRDWLVQSDYPAQARAKHVSGTVHIMWSVEPSGQIGRCIIVELSGESSLDEATCTALMKRARYDPALDVTGKPVRVWDARSVRWTPPAR